MGTRPWSKPDFYYRALGEGKPTAAFTSKSPGPGMVMSAEDAPGSILGKTPVRRAADAFGPSTCLCLFASRNGNAPRDGVLVSMCVVV